MTAAGPEPRVQEGHDARLEGARQRRDRVLRRHGHLDRGVVVVVAELFGELSSGQIENARA